MVKTINTQVILILLFILWFNVYMVKIFNSLSATIKYKEVCQIMKYEKPKLVEIEGFKIAEGSPPPPPPLPSSELVFYIDEKGNSILDRTV